MNLFCFYIMNNHFQLLIDRLKERFGTFLGIGLGIFLFVLFFEPFSIYLLDLNNRLVFLVGLTALFFLLMLFVICQFSTSSAPLFHLLIPFF